MKCVSQFLIFIVLTFIIASTVFANLSDATFDSSNSVILSEGSMRKVSIPLPTGWKDGFRNQKMVDDIREQVQNFFPVENILAHYYNPKRNTEYVEVLKVKKLDGIVIPYKAFKDMQEEYDKALEDGRAKADFIKKIPVNVDKDIDKRFQFFPSHEKDDHSFQYTSVGLTLDKKTIVFSIVSEAIIWMHNRVFIVAVRTIAANQSKTMDKMQETRFFMSHWVEAILSENDCEAHDMSDTNTPKNENGTIDENTSGSPKASESISSNDADNETMSSKSKVMASLEKLKAKVNSVVAKDEQDDEASTEHSNEDTAEYNDRPSIWRKILPKGFLIALLSCIAYHVKKRRK